jgi:glycosyltransferase involved in cell wall biosynthesis
MTTVGLCMIAKDEAAVIGRCIRSALPLIDFVLIADTGSTDGTQAAIRDCLRDTGIPGEVLDQPWRDFAYNRTLALERLRGRREIDYALINDADDEFVFDDGFDAAAFKATMTAGLYDVEIRHGAIRHYRPQILSNALNFSYRGVLHEFVEGPREGHSRATAAGFHIRIGDGGTRSRDPAKFGRDAAMLEQALNTEHDPFLVSRYTFYLAQSYRDAGEPAKALAAYLKRPPLGFWDEEIFISLLNAARLMEQLGHSETDVISAYRRAYDAAPTRAEALHGASQFCRTRRRFAEGHEFARLGSTLPIPTGALFVEPWIYEYGLLDELAVNAYWARHYQASLEASERLLHERRLPPDMRPRVMENARWAAEKLATQSTGAAQAGDYPASNIATMQQVPITVVNIRPPDDAHSGAYQDLADTVRCGLQHAGHEVRLADSLDCIAGPAIVLGAHLAARYEIEPLPAGVIIYNTEHTTSNFMTEAYLELLRRQPVWDYSQDNTSALGARLGKTVLHVPTGYVAELARVPRLAEEDFDVLFYGSMNARRQLVLDQLSAADVRVETGFGVYGAARDALIARAKIVLNIHFYEPGHFEAVRVSYLLANAKAVVTELNPGEAIDADLAAGVAVAPYGSLADVALSLIADEPRRRALAVAGHKAFVARDETAILLTALAMTFGTDGLPAPSGCTLPTRLTIGSGRTWSADALNIDADPRWHPDIVADIGNPGLFSELFQSARFGPARLARGYFTAITASHVLEHVRDLVTAMTNCLNLLAGGGLMHITVPYDLSYGAWQDPTHVRAFNERSWWYYCDWYWYIGWTEARFDLITQTFVYSDIGESLRARGMTEQAIMGSPRAVDEMRVVLRKRRLTETEKEHGHRMRGSTR